MEFQLTFQESISGVANFVTGLTQADIDFVRADNHSTVVDYSYFDEIGDGQYNFGTFDVPEVSLNLSTGQWNPSVVLVLPRISGVIQQGFSEIAVWNDAYIPVSIGDVYPRVDKLGDTVLNHLTYDISLSGINGFDPFNIPQDSYYRFRIPAVGWVLNTISSSLSAVNTSSLSGYMTLATEQNVTGKKNFYGGTTFDLGTSVVGTNSKFRITSASNPPNGGITLMEAGYTNDNTGLFDYKNSKVLFSGAVTGTSNWTLAGATFSNNVTHNAKVTFNTSTVDAVATKFNLQAATIDAKKITVSALTVNRGMFNQYLNLSEVGTESEFFVVGYNNTDGVSTTAMSIRADGSFETPVIDFHNSQIVGLNFNTTSFSSSLSAYMPTSGGNFSGSVTASGARLHFPNNTTISGATSSAYLRNVSATSVNTNTMLVSTATATHIISGSSDIFLNQVKSTIQYISATGQKLSNSHSTVLCLSDGFNPFSVLLPDAGVNGKTITIKHVDYSLGGTLSIDGNGRNIDESSSISISNLYGSVTLQYNIIGDSWWILSRHLS